MFIPEMNFQNNLKPCKISKNMVLMLFKLPSTNSGGNNFKKYSLLAERFKDIFVTGYELTNS